MSDEQKRWRDLRKRAISAAILGPLALLAIWLGAGWYTLMISAGTAILAWEWVHLCGKRVRALPGLAVPVALLAAGFAAVANHHLLALMLLPLGALAATWAAEPPPRRVPGGPALWLGAGVVYIGLAGVGLIWMRGEGEAGRAAVLFIVLIVWASDIGAYMVGRMVGGPKLAPSISPNKTWSGALGGLAAAVAAGLAVAFWFDALARPVQVALIAALLGIAAAAGDLLESAIKRRFHVKDSSGLIPGHGGLLDRVDGLLAAVPMACVIALAQGFTRGGERFLWT
ncbi:phosphatidate cytidylyltransferase [Elioraea rosea]|uniref:phosphatidate cytidylyltransferase n=1 Tax=Elioraea rosea TaxID=2492390 RepID=UPI001EF527A1|nr:phosphatidate cytidylyltransferase [Elioraea rosea]